MFQAARKRCFPPVADAQVLVLVLGSLPGERSLAAQQYYAHPQNQFWELTSALLGIDLRAMPYAARLQALLARGVGLWDVIADAERPGSLDVAITKANHNALIELLRELPQLRAVGFNGATAARLGRRHLRQGDSRIALIDLPSSSPAHTIGFASKLAGWRQLEAYLHA